MRLILNGGINNALAFKVQVAKLTKDNQRGKNINCERIHCPLK